jgi:hypothetical protein
MIQSDNQFDNGVWRDFTIDDLLERVGVDEAVLCSHVLASGWSELVELIPHAEKKSIVDTIRMFRSNGWVAFTFVRHPVELLTSFYFYILDAHERGWHDSVALHTAAVGRSLDDFVSEHCEKELLPEYWREYDYVGEATDAHFKVFFDRYFNHDFKTGAADSHASGSRGYAYYCGTGELSQSTQTRIERSRNMEIYREILESLDPERSRG